MIERLGAVRDKGGNSMKHKGKEIAKYKNKVTL